MKYAHLNGEKIEAFKGAKGLCPSCESELIAKCGDIRINYWSHKAARNCDVWWENETEWHRKWKGQFPIDWQEVVHFDETGEKHIADVKNKGDWVIEFQHSFINCAELQSRNAFYKKISWVVDGVRRKTDLPQFNEVLKNSRVIKLPQLQFIHVNFPEESHLIKDWQGLGVPVFFDFTGLSGSLTSLLWLLIPSKLNHEAFLLPLSKEQFIEIHTKNSIEQVVRNVVEMISIYLNEGDKRRKQEESLRISQLRVRGRRGFSRRF